MFDWQIFNMKIILFESFMKIDLWNCLIYECIIIKKNWSENEKWKEEGSLYNNVRTKVQFLFQRLSGYEDMDDILID